MAANPTNAELRAQLYEAEKALTAQREAVAEMRRQLQPQPLAKEYTFVVGEPGGDTREVPLAELFADPGKPLILVHNMGNECPLCTMWADTHNATVPHIQQNANFVVASETALAEMHGIAQQRGWDKLALAQMKDSSLNNDYGISFPSGAQGPGISVFVMVDGAAHHFYSTILAHGMPVNPHGRGIDLYSPVWQLLDLLPNGRGDWDPSLVY